MHQTGMRSNKTFRFCHGCRGAKCGGRCDEALNGTFVSKNMSYIPNDCKFRNIRGSGVKYISPKNMNRVYGNIMKSRKASESKKKNKHLRGRLLNPTEDREVCKMKRERVNPSKVIECPICLTVKGKYKTLGCGHEICTSCHTNILKSDTLQDNCPMCRKSIFNDNFVTYLLCARRGVSKSYSLVNVEYMNGFDSDSDDSYESDDSYDSDNSYYSEDFN